jgi:hypothetical protein
VDPDPRNNVGNGLGGYASGSAHRGSRSGCRTVPESLVLLTESYFQRTILFPSISTVSVPVQQFIQLETSLVSC